MKVRIGSGVCLLLGAAVVLLTACGSLLPSGQRSAPLPDYSPTDVSAPLITAAAPATEETLLPPIIPAASATPVPTLPLRGPQTLNILLLGSDARSGEKGPWRTDTIMWVTVHRDTKEVGILSIPRDLWVSIPTIGENRINVADYYGTVYKYEGGGPALVAAILKNSFGIETHRYIRLNFEAFEAVIDAMGGITVLVDCPLEDNFIDDSMPNGFRPLKVSAGAQVMDGKTALMFARSRHGTGDIDRTRRQQRVLMGIRDRALDVNLLPRIPRIWSSLQQSIDTDLSLQEILALALLAKDITPERVHGTVIDFTMVRNWTTPQGAMVLLPDYAKIRQAIENMMSTPPLLEATSGQVMCAE